jgi:Domain of unknown function (DUF4150)
MGCDVYANNNEIACKAGDGKVIATFPDVCLSPPSPPAGPLPVPYPDTSFSKDMKEGSKTVLIKDQEVMLKDQSYYNTSPLGDEAATKGLGAGVVSHVITGKTYFVAWSMDVKFEGANVDRHIDMTTSNHASLVPNASVPWANMSSQQIAEWEDREGTCACCNQPQHAGRQGAPVVSEDDFYATNEQVPADPVPTHHPGDKKEVIKHEKACADLAKRRAQLRNRQRRVGEARHKGCMAPKPCNVYRQVTPDQKKMIEKEWDDYAPTYQNEKGVPLKAGGVHETTNHLTPKAAGGCPVGDNNLKADKATLDKSAQVSSNCAESVKEMDNMANEVSARRNANPPTL